MLRSFGFLRAVNVGGRRVLMTDLTAALRAANLQEPESFIASGNFTFLSKASEATKQGPAEVAIEAALEKQFGFRAEVFVRTQGELAAVAKLAEPLTKLANVHAVQIGFLRRPPSRDDCANFGSFESRFDHFTFGPREVVWVAHDRVSETPFGKKGSSSKQLPLVTFRNLNTIVRMLAKWP
jgi:uncharacterized protein (DUF1697 family)